MKLLISLGISALLCGVSQAADKETRVFELRTYYANPGKLDALLARFRDHTVSIFERNGMINLGYWVPADNKEDQLIYLLAYPSRDAAKKAWADFGTDPEWLQARAASEANGKLVKRVDSVYMTATDYSPVVTPAKSTEPRLFELREYEASPGKLDALNARFRDHTTGLFTKHGMTNFGYWTPLDADKGAGHKLIYIVAHKDKAAGDASWKAFRADPDWNKAKTASEANGALTTPGGVKSTFMVPTDFSQTK